MLYGHSFRKAYVSIGVGFLVMAVAIVLFGPPLTEVESEIMGWSAFVVALANMFWLYHREDRARERAAGEAENRDSRADRLSG